MKTTVEIPDPLLRKAKARAAERGQTLKEFMSEALQEKLTTKAANARTGEREWMEGFGKLNHLRKETARIQKRVDKIFEVIEPQDRAIGSGQYDARGVRRIRAISRAVRRPLRRHTRAAIPVIVLGKLRYGIVGSQAGRRETPRAGRPG